jgi:hypothetical protein
MSRSGVQSCSLAGYDFGGVKPVASDTAALVGYSTSQPVAYSVPLKRTKLLQLFKQFPIACTLAVYPNDTHWQSFFTKHGCFLKVIMHLFKTIKFKFHRLKFYWMAKTYWPKVPTNEIFRYRECFPLLNPVAVVYNACSRGINMLNSRDFASVTTDTSQRSFVLIQKAENCYPFLSRNFSTYLQTTRLLIPKLQ